MKNPFRTRYRARKYMLDVVHRVEYKRWWQRKWRTHSVYDTKEEALLALKRLTMKKKYRRAVCKMLLWVTTPFAAITYIMALPAISIHDLRIWLNDGKDPD